MSHKLWYIKSQPRIPTTAVKYCCKLLTDTYFEQSTLIVTTMFLLKGHMH